jgi:hypothetical protein
MEVFEMIDFVAMFKYIEKSFDIQTHAVQANPRDYDHDAIPTVCGNCEENRRSLSKVLVIHARR